MIGPGFESHQCLLASIVEEIDSIAMLSTKQSVGVTPDLNLREHVTQMPLISANKAAHSGFEAQRRRHQKSKTEVSVALQKGLMFSKNFKEKKMEIKMEVKTQRIFFYQRKYERG